MPQLPHHAMLDDAGLNRQHVFDLARLPAELLAPLATEPHETQLLLFGHGGRRLWSGVQAALRDGRVGSRHPIDDYSMATVRAWLAQALPHAVARFVYPAGLPAGRHLALQRLGSLAGWHHATPFLVGIDAQWGSWFAYRAAIVTDTRLAPTERRDLGHPCEACIHKPCMAACPAGALDSGTLDLPACHQHRLAEGSACAHDCLARRACPVGAEHRYDDGQIQHGGRSSLASIRRCRAA